MSNARKNILARIQKTNVEPEVAVPHFDYKLATVFPNLVEEFCAITKAVGAMVHIQSENEKIDDIIRQYFPKEKSFAGDTEQLQLEIINRPLNTTANAHDLQDVEVGIIAGVFGVAENGAIWVSQTEKFRAIYFIPEKLVILVNHKEIVPLMHDAYKWVHFTEKGFGVFISGPSKTADIEQSLVIGAHGPGDTLVILTQ